MTAEPLRINLNAGPVAPKHWNVTGSRFQRSSTPWKPMMDAFPEYCDRSRLGQYSIREFEVMRPGVYRGNRVFEATEEKMRQFEANFNPSATIYELSIVTKQAVPTARLSEDLATKAKPAPVPSMATLKTELEEYRVEYDRWRKQRELSHQKEEADRAMLREAFGIAPAQASSKRPENTDKSELAMLRKAAGFE